MGRVLKPISGGFDFMKCLLEDRECNNCGACDICDLYPGKICDNCCACIDDPSGLRTIIIRKEDLEADEVEKPQKIYRRKASAKK